MVSIHQEQIKTQESGKLDIIYPNVYIDQCKFGRGVFAARDILKGEIILVFTGKIISFAVVIQDVQGHVNPMQIGQDSYMDLEYPGVLVNHHCNPNAGVVGQKLLVAIENIHANEQIFFDYSTTMSEDCWTMECRCEASNCRKTVTDFHYLPKEVKQRYLNLGIVNDFIVDEHNLLVLKKEWSSTFL